MLRAAVSVMVLCMFLWSSLVAMVYSSEDRLSYAVRNPSVPSPYNPFRSGVMPEKGVFLVASETMRDPRFSEAVILLVDYGLHGATGLIINRPTDMDLLKVLPEIEQFRQMKQVLYYGGPVDKKKIFLLMKSGRSVDDSIQVLKDVYVSQSRKVLLRMLGKNSGDEKLRIISGYSGWAPQQLDREISRGDWHVLAADSDTIFEREVEKIWPELIRRSSVKWVQAAGNLLRRDE